MTLLAVLSLAGWIYLLLFHGRFWQDGPFLPDARPREALGVTIVVPARDEAATIQAVLRSLLSQDYAGPLRVILVDDQSRDGTGTLARAVVDPRLRVISGAPRPPDWSGKLWAVAQGVACAETPLLLLTDADITHTSGHLATLVAGLERMGCAMVSEMVALNCQSRAERLLVPAFVYFFQMLYPFARVNDPTARTAAAAGGTVLLRTQALARAGGIAAIRGALIDDVALAAVIKPGGRIWLGHSRRAVSRRSYPQASDIWRMIERTAYVELRHSPLRLILCVAGLALVWFAAPVALLLGSGPARLLALITYLGFCVSYLPTLRRFRLSPVYALALPAIAGFYLAATLSSAWRHHRGLGVAWKSRAYREAR